MGKIVLSTVMILSAAMALLLASAAVFTPIGVALDLATDHSPAYLYKGAAVAAVMAIGLTFIAVKCYNALRKPKQTPPETQF